MGYEVTTMDLDPKWKADFQVDVMTWRYWEDLQPGQYNVVVAAVPCTEYSRALTTRPRDLPAADRIVQRTLEIIRYLQPERWWMENPRHGLLPTRKFMNGL